MLITDCASKKFKAVGVIVLSHLADRIYDVHNGKSKRDMRHHTPYFRQQTLAEYYSVAFGETISLQTISKADEFFRTYERIISKVLGHCFIKRWDALEKVEEHFQTLLKKETWILLPYSVQSYWFAQRKPLVGLVTAMQWVAEACHDTSNGCATGVLDELMACDNSVPEHCVQEGITRFGALELVAA